MATIQNNINRICREIDRFQKVTRFKFNKYNARKDSATWTNNDPNITALYYDGYRTVSQVLDTLHEIHDQFLLPWAAKWSLTTPTDYGDMLSGKADLRRLYASKTSVNAPCRNQGFTDENFPEGNSYADSFYRIFSRLGSDANAIAGRMEYWIQDEVQPKFPDQNARELAPILERIQGLAFQLRTHMVDVMLQDSSRRSVTAYDIFELGEAIYGRRIRSIDGGLYLLNQDATCASGPALDPYNTKVSITNDLPLLVA